MIAACPKCKARYRIDRRKLSPDGVRLRCSRCEAVFRVRAPEDGGGAAGHAAAPRSAPAAAREPAPATEPAPPKAPAAPEPVYEPDRGVLLALPDAEVAKRTADLLRERGLHVVMATDGVEAMLEIQRRTPRAVLLAADLAKMFGFQVCEVVKRNESLSSTFVVLAGAIHHQDRYRRPPGELYGADAYLEVPDLPEGLLPLLSRAGLPLGTANAPAPQAPAPPPPAPSPAPKPQAAGDGLDEERAKADRLARIIVSDIVLYNEEKFSKAVQQGNVETAMESDLAEGRGLFQERIDPRIREERDHLMDELVRVARTRGMT